MVLTKNELETLKMNSLSISNAKDIANQIESDLTVGGIFPNAETGNFENPNIEIFTQKWLWWWLAAKILLKLAKVFTGEKADKVIDKIILLGDSINIENH
jgi:hypothetical protein